MFETITKGFGVVEILVNNAGVGTGDRFRNKPDPELLTHNLETHLWGAVNCCTSALDGMLANEYGKIINITSIHTKNGIGMSLQYDIAKYSLLGSRKRWRSNLDGTERDPRQCGCAWLGDDSNDRVI